MGTTAAGRAGPAAIDKCVGSVAIAAKVDSAAAVPSAGRIPGAGRSATGGTTAIVGRDRDARATGATPAPTVVARTGTGPLVVTGPGARAVEIGPTGRAGIVPLARIVPVARAAPVVGFGETGRERIAPVAGIAATGRAGKGPTAGVAVIGPTDPAETAPADGIAVTGPIGRGVTGPRAPLVLVTGPTGRVEMRPVAGIGATVPVVRGVPAAGCAEIGPAPGTAGATRGATRRPATAAAPYAATPVAATGEAGTGETATHGIRGTATPGIGGTARTAMPVAGRRGRAGFLLAPTNDAPAGTDREVTGRDATGREVTGRDATGREVTGLDTTGRTAKGRDATGHDDGPRREGPRRDGPNRDGPRGDGPRRDGPIRDKPADQYRREPDPEPEAVALPEDLDPRTLGGEVRGQLRALARGIAEQVSLRHWSRPGELIDEDPEAALAHALAARRLASRIAAVREAVGLAAYRAGEWQTAIGELRAYHRMCGRQTHLAVLADCERALGPPGAGDRPLPHRRPARSWPRPRPWSCSSWRPARAPTSASGEAAVAMLQVRELTLATTSRGWRGCGTRTPTRCSASGARTRPGSGSPGRRRPTRTR